jgi:hypothetical protein
VAPSTLIISIPILYPKPAIIAVGAIMKDFKLCFLLKLSTSLNYYYLKLIPRVEPQPLNNTIFAYGRFYFFLSIFII